MSQPAERPMPSEPAGQHTDNTPPARERAEVLVDQLGMQLGSWTNRLGNELQRFWAHTREEGEDILAEAQDIRARNHVGTGGTGPAMSSSASRDATSQAQAAEPRESAAQG